MKSIVSFAATLLIAGAALAADINAPKTAAKVDETVKASCEKSAGSDKTAYEKCIQEKSATKETTK